MPRVFWSFVVALMIISTGCGRSGDESQSSSQLSSRSEGRSLGTNEYWLGAGIYDITGPAAEIGMMGFADSKQKTAGIHTRLRSRAFIIGDEAKRVVLVSADLGMLFQMVKIKLIERIQKNAQLAAFYNEKNVMLSATHTHGGPGGYSGYFLYDATVNGFVRENFNTIVEGIYQSILRAHKNLQVGKILIKQGLLDGVGGNRAEAAYANNPASERAAYGSSTDKSFTLLKFVGIHGEEIGLLNWYAVHPSSIGPANHLITADNKGWASYLFETLKASNYFAEKTFVAAFAQANAGDVTPNIGFGEAPPELSFAKNKSLENATLGQFNKARELYDSATEEVSGSIDVRHEWVDMRSLYVEKAQAYTCAAAMGASFSAGSPFDNPSPFPLFPNGTTVASLNWHDNAASTLLSAFLGSLFHLVWSETNSEDYKKCQAEKPVLIPTGIAHLNWNGPSMSPQIMPLQVIKIGSLAVVAVPAEVTTMSGRRFKKAVLDELAPMGVKYSVVSALANSYASYLATREEYAKQWYEGASTQFGPNEQLGFQQEFVKLSKSIAQGKEIDPGQAPMDITDQTVDFTAKPGFDEVPASKNFGDLIQDVRDQYAQGEMVTVQFWGGHPNHNYRIQDSFLIIEALREGVYVPIAYDWDPQTSYRWERGQGASSKISISWDTLGAAPGQYRIRHRGDYKSKASGLLSAYEGVSNTFTITR